MAGFRELAKAHMAMTKAYEVLHKEHGETRALLSQLLNSHNGFFQRGWRARLRWLVKGT